MKMNKKTILVIAIICILVYLIFHTIYGNRGILSYFKLKSEVKEMSSILDQKKITRLNLEKQVQNLLSDTMDKDLIEEKAKKLLFLSNKNEEIVINHD